AGGRRAPPPQRGEGREDPRQRLPRAGRRLDENVTAAGDGGPALRLRRRRLGEVALEPRARPGTEKLQRLHDPSLAPTSPGTTGPFTVRTWSPAPRAARRIPTVPA